MPRPDALKCVNCEATLGRLEDAYVWLDRPVCKSCFTTLSRSRIAANRTIWLPVAVALALLSTALAILLALHRSNGSVQSSATSAKNDQAQAQSHRSPTSDGSPPPTFQNERTWESRAARARELNNAEDEYRNQVITAQRKYDDSLLQAKQAAMKSGNLDEANAVQAEIKQVEAQIGAIPSAGVAQVSPELIIRRARYGAGDNLADVTALLNSQIHEGRIDSPRVPDPASGVVKSIFIEGTYGGHDFVLSFPENFPLLHMVFGRPEQPQTKDRPGENGDTLEGRRERPVGERDASNDPHTGGLSRSSIMSILRADRTWYWHWEDRSKDRPFKFVIDESGRISNNTQPEISDSLELRWVLIHDGHLLVPTDSQTFEGFHLESGRQVGEFTEQRLQ